MPQRLNPDLRHLLVWLLVVAAHVGMLQLSWLKSMKRIVVGDGTAVMLLPVISVTPPVLDIHAPARKSVAHVSRPVTVPPLAQQSIDSTEGLSGTSGPQANARIDWLAEAQLAAQLAARTGSEEPAMRQFGNSSSSSSITSTSVSGVFTSPKHRFGETSRLVNGDSVLWLSEHCYQVLNSDESRQMAFLRGAPDTSQGARRCTYPVGKPKANGDLFKPLKATEPESTEQQ